MITPNTLHSNLSSNRLTVQEELLARGIIHSASSEFDIHSDMVNRCISTDVWGNEIFSNHIYSVGNEEVEKDDTMPTLENYCKMDSSSDLDDDSGVQVRYLVEWIHKKGKRKPQQFWVYCEDSQDNYLRAILNVPGFQWHTNSRVAFFKENRNKLVFVESWTHSVSEVRGLIVEKEKTPCICAIPIDSLDIVSSADCGRLNFTLELVEDTSQPIYPHQGSASKVVIAKHEFNNVAECPPPMEYTCCFLFKNRSQGWFKIQATLFLDNQPLITGESELFMFNNPRLIKKRELLEYTSFELKFMQCYAMEMENIYKSHSMGLVEDTKMKWAKLGSAHFSMDRLKQLIDNSHITLSQKRRKKRDDSEESPQKPFTPLPDSALDNIFKSRKRSSSAEDRTAAFAHPTCGRKRCLSDVAPMKLQKTRDVQTLPEVEAPLHSFGVKEEKFSSQKDQPFHSFNQTFDFTSNPFSTVFPKQQQMRSEEDVVMEDRFDNDLYDLLPVTSDFPNAFSPPVQFTFKESSPPYASSFFWNIM